MRHAHHVLGRSVYRSEGSAIKDYIKLGKSQDALTLYFKMRENCSVHILDVHTLVALLNASAKLKDLERGVQIHHDVTKMGLLERDPFVGNALLDMYAKCGLLAKAQEVFDKLSVQDVASWNALIAGYAKHGRSVEGLELFAQMQKKGVSPNAITFIFSLKACSSIRATDKGIELHAEIERKGLLKRDLFVGSTLVDLYAKCGLLVKAQEVFDKLPVRNTVSWTALIAGYTEHGQGEEALRTFKQMKLDGVSANPVTYTCCLKACSSLKAIDKGGELHHEIENKGFLEGSITVGNALVDMYIKCGSLTKAQQVFDKLLSRDAVSWNAIITGYAEHDHGEEALLCLKQMKIEGVLPNSITYISSLKACGNLGAIEKVQELHADITAEGSLATDVVVGSTLVDTYAHHGSFDKAQKVFDTFSVRNIVLWNALISGYAKHGLGKTALQCFEQMQLESFSPDAVTFVCALKACASSENRDNGFKIHSEIERRGFMRKDVVVGNALVDMYAKCRLLVEAQVVFDKLLVKDVICWNALVEGYTEQGHAVEALECLDKMQLEGVCPSAVTYVLCMKACGRIGTMDKGGEIHAQIARRGLLNSDFIVGSTVDMYAQCGSLVKAQEVFDNLTIHTLVSWKALIAGYADSDCGEEALNCFKKMQMERVSPDAVSYLHGLKACCHTGATEKGREFHAEIVKKGFDKIDLAVSNALVDMYATCDLVAEAQNVFDELPTHNIVSWNALIAGYVKHGLGDVAIKYFEQMQIEGVCPNGVTFVTSLNACGSIKDTEEGKKIHAEVEMKGLLQEDPVVGTAVVDMYAKCSFLIEAQKVFDKLPAHDVASWNALIYGYLEQGNGEKALECFAKMQLDGFSPDMLTFVCSLKACASINAIYKGEGIHDVIAERGLLNTDPLVGNTLIDMYIKCGLLSKAQKVFDKLSIRNVASWTTLITGYVDHGHSEAALGLFRKMRLDGISPNEVTLLCSLKACGSIGAADIGLELHDEIERKGLLDSNLIIGTSLLDMYVKCGWITIARQVFDRLPVRSVVSWNLLISGYAQLGDSKNVFHTFDRMLKECIKPDLATFAVVLNTCSQAGLLDKGQMYLEAMTTYYGITPALEHLTCIIDLLGRAGELDKAITMIKKLSIHADNAVWHTVLDACRKWGNVELGRQVFQHALNQDG